MRPKLNFWSASIRHQYTGKSRLPAELAGTPSEGRSEILSTVPELSNQRGKDHRAEHSKDLVTVGNKSSRNREEGSVGKKRCGGEERKKIKRSAAGGKREAGTVRFSLVSLVSLFSLLFPV